MATSSLQDPTTSADANKVRAMDRQARKAAIAEYKEREPAWGVFSVTCLATGEKWVGRSRHVDTEQNGLWFTLKLGTSVFPSLQNAWRQHGGDSFEFDELERLREDSLDFGRMDKLRERQDYWRARLRASPL